MNQHKKYLFYNSIYVLDRLPAVNKSGLKFTIIYDGITILFTNVYTNVNHVKGEEK